MKLTGKKLLLIAMMAVLGACQSPPSDTKTSEGEPSTAEGQTTEDGVASTYSAGEDDVKGGADQNVTDGAADSAQSALEQRQSSWDSRTRCSSYRAGCRQ